MEYDKRVKVVLINLFGGALDIKPIAEGIVKGLSLKVISKPLIIRVRGNFENEVEELFKEYQSENNNGANQMYLFKDFDLAVFEAVKVAAEAELGKLM